MRRRLALITIATAAVAGLVLFTDFTMLFGIFGVLSPVATGVLIALFLLGAVLKGLRWAFYLRQAYLDIRWRDGLTSYLGALATAAVPGGSWLAPRLAQEHGHIRMRQAAAALFVNFIGDAIALSSVVFALFIFTDQPAYRFAVPAGGLAIGITAIAMGRSILVWTFVHRTLGRWRVTSRLLPKEIELQARIRVLMRPRVIFGGILFSVSTTIVTAAFLYVLVNALTFRGISGIEGLFVLSVAEATAIVIPITGGFGVTDSSMAGMLTTLGIGFRRATFVALMFRSFELVMKTTLGTTVLLARYDRFLLNALDIRARTRGAFRVAGRVPGLGFLAHIPILPARRTRVTAKTRDEPELLANPATIDGAGD